MGRNIDLDEMIKEKQTKCCKCGQTNKRAFEEFDIDCYEFEDGLCYYEFRCENCEYKNYFEITINLKNINKDK